MAKKNKDVRELFVGKIKAFKKIDPVPRMSSVYTTYNEVLLEVRYSAMLDKGYYWFFIDTHRIKKWKDKQRFVECLLCGDENTVVFVPDSKIFEWFADVEPNNKGHWFIKIQPDGERLMIKIGHGHPDIDAQDYLNRFDLISPLIPRPTPNLNTTPSTPSTNFEEVKSLIMSDNRIEGETLHEKIIDVLFQIGEWSGYEATRSYAVEPKSPYAIDVVWLKNKEIDLAIEVQDSGNETEAKDRLRQALRFGARKVAVVSSPTSVTRLKNICRFEPDLKNWLEIWSIERIYKMYRSGYEFYSEYRPFYKRQRSDDIAEYL